MAVKGTLDECIQHYLATREVAMMEDYLYAMPRDEVGKAELIKAIGNYDIPILYDTLFTNYGNLLTPEEKLEYSRKAVDTFDYAPSLLDTITKFLEQELGIKVPSEDEETEPEEDEMMTFTVTNDQGEEVECEVLVTFEREGKDYIVYTDNTLDEEGNTNVFASIMVTEGEQCKLLPIETAEEWAIIEQLLEELQNQ